MSLSRNIIDFSANGEYLAYSSPDGCLKIWETATSILKQEYTPSSHLSTTCSSLSWGPCKQSTFLSPKSKKSRGSSFSNIADLQLIAMGTLTGDVLLYSFTNADLSSLLSKGHTSTVNDICWYAATNSLFSCSNDQHIIVWDISNGKIKSKWKADKVAVHSICVIDDNNMLSSSSSIMWWNIKEMTVIKTFTGCASEVFRLLPIHTEDNPSNCYFLSMAVGDRVINAWQLNENNSRNAVASFVLSEEPESIDIISVKNEPLLMSVVLKDGSFHLFEHRLNGRVKKPLHPKFSVHVASKVGKLHPVPIIAAHISRGLNSCILTYGSFLKPVCETIDISEVCKDLHLIRDVSLATAVSVEEGVSKVKHAEKPDNVKLLAPGHMTAPKHKENSTKKRKQKETDIKELPMEERLKALDLSTIPKNLEEQEPSVKSDSMVHLLLQGLQSKDKDMLNTVLQCSDEKVIKNTMERIPIQSILLVLKEINHRLNKQEPRNHPCLKWLKGLLSVHLPYLMSCKDVDEYLGPISQLIEARTENFFKMFQLKGCLQILLSQAASSRPNVADPSSEPLVVYQSDSSEESDDNEMDLSDKGSEDNVSEDKEPSEESESSATESDMES